MTAEYSFDHRNDAHSACEAVLALAADAETDEQIVSNLQKNPQADRIIATAMQRVSVAVAVLVSGAIQGSVAEREEKNKIFLNDLLGDDRYARFQRIVECMKRVSMQIHQSVIQSLAHSNRHFS